MRLTRATIPSDGVSLAALRYSPESHGRSQVVVLAHGYTASKESMDLMAGYLCHRGWECVAFDFRGHKLGASTGEMHAPDDAVADLGAAAHWAMLETGRSEAILVGHSMGGVASVVVGSRLASVVAVVGLACGVGTAHEFGTPAGAAMVRQRDDYVAGAPARQVLAGLDPLLADVRGMWPRPALLVAARGDIVVKARRVRDLAERIGPTAEVLVADAGHYDVPDLARGAVANWLDGHFPRTPHGAVAY